MEPREAFRASGLLALAESGGRPLAPRPQETSGLHIKLLAGLRSLTEGFLGKDLDARPSVS